MTQRTFTDLLVHEEQPDTQPVLVRCLPRGTGRNTYGHVWEDNAPEAVCQCGAKRYGQVRALVKASDHG